MNKIKFFWTLIIRLKIVKIHYVVFLPPCFDFSDCWKGLSRKYEIAIQVGRKAKLPSSIGEIISGGRLACLKFRSAAREYPSWKSRKLFFCARVYWYEILDCRCVVVVAVIVSIFIVAVLSSNNKLETSANDRGDRTKNIEYIGRNVEYATRTEK